jgi:hypothetical protein
MDLGQQSNLGSLISAVLVGLLALASNQYARMDRSTLKSFVDGLQHRTRVVSVHRPEDEGKASIVAVEKEITRLESYLAGVFEQWKDSKLRATDPRITGAWTAIGNVVTKLDSDAELWDKLSSRSRVDLMWILFWAAEMNPPEFSSHFLDVSQRISEQETETVGAQAAVLQLYHGHDRNEPNETMLAERLEEFARQNPRDMIGVFMYLIMARELFDNGHTDMSERLLRRGIQIYSSYPGHVGSSRLINELMDQKMPKGR